MRNGKIIVKDDNKRSIFNFNIEREEDIDNAGNIIKKKFFGER